jgi:hypothetical protein
MAQDFERHLHRNIGTATVVHTSNSDDAIVGIRVANTHVSTTVNVDAYITMGGKDYYIIKSAPVPSGGSLELIDGGSKIVIQSGDALTIDADAATSDWIISRVDAIST